MNKTPRLRMFAGPNGSGKSTLNTIINKELLGVYINADEIEKKIESTNFFDLQTYHIEVDNEEIISFILDHPLIKKANLTEIAKNITAKDNKIDFSKIEINSYFASVCADFVRHRLLELEVSFTFETVMSSPDKVEFLKKAQSMGYRTYLYFIATQDPIINISRVANRVKRGGHDVPKDKIISRYHRSLELLKEAIKYSNRAYIFDNSSQEKLWLAEITDANEILLKQKTIPLWLEEYLLKI